MLIRTNELTAGELTDNSQIRIIVGTKWDSFVRGRRNNQGNQKEAQQNTQTTDIQIVNAIYLSVFSDELAHRS